VWTATVDQAFNAIDAGMAHARAARPTDEELLEDLP